MNCFDCNGCGEICDVCGEAENACQCDEAAEEGPPTFSPCSYCGGTGVVEPPGGSGGGQ